MKAPLCLFLLGLAALIREEQSATLLSPRRLVGCVFLGIPPLVAPKLFANFMCTNLVGMFDGVKHRVGVHIVGPMRSSIVEGAD